MKPQAILSTIMPLVLAACGGGGGGGTAPTPTPNSPSSSYPLGAPAAATVGNSPPPTAAGGFQQAVPSGTTFTGSGSGLPPAGTVFALTQTAYQFPAAGGSADVQTMNAGATVTVVDLSKGLVELKIPNLGVDAIVKDDSITTTSLSGGKTLLFGLNGNGASGTVLANLNYTALGNWVVENASTGLATNMGAYVAGYQTPLASMPISGSATYGGTGTVNGVVLIPNGGTGGKLTGDSSLTANFSTGAMTGTFTNMAATSVTGGAPTPWNNVSVAGNISGATFSGQTATSSTPGGALALGSATGTIKGGFYGPAANEAGAVWTLFDGSRAAFGGVAGPRIPSDRRLKRDIRPLATAANGMQLYSFRYFTGARTFVGVMAQDLLNAPRFAAAVDRRPSGLMLVDYSRLGLDVVDVDAMREAGQAAIEAYESLAVS
jgi:hypothetical protein